MSDRESSGMVDLQLFLAGATWTSTSQAPHLPPAPAGAALTWRLLQQPHQRDAAPRHGGIFDTPSGRSGAGMELHSQCGLPQVL